VTYRQIATSSEIIASDKDACGVSYIMIAGNV